MAQNRRSHGGEVVDKATLVAFFSAVTPPDTDKPPDGRWAPQVHDMGLCSDGAGIPPVLATRLGRTVAHMTGIAEASSRDARLRDVLQLLDVSTSFLAAKRLLKSATMPFLRHLLQHVTTVLDLHTEAGQAKLFRDNSWRIFLSKRPGTAAFTIWWVKVLCIFAGALLLASLQFWRSDLSQEFVHTGRRVRFTVVALRDRSVRELSSTHVPAFGLSRGGRPLSDDIAHCHVVSSQQMSSVNVSFANHTFTHQSVSRTAASVTMTFESAISFDGWFLRTQGSGFAREHSIHVKCISNALLLSLCIRTPHTHTHTHTHTHIHTHTRTHEHTNTQWQGQPTRIPRSSSWRCPMTRARRGSV